MPRARKPEAHPIAHRHARVAGRETLPRVCE
jgi:hypothetical protein